MSQWVLEIVFHVLHTTSEHQAHPGSSKHDEHLLDSSCAQSPKILIIHK